MHCKEISANTIAKQIKQQLQTMEPELPPPEFTFDQEIATCLASCELLSKAWKELLRACENSPQNFTLTVDEDVVYVAFPSFQRVEDFIFEESEYGQGNAQTIKEIFSGCLEGNDDQPVHVHQGALKLFLDIMKNTDLEAKICIQVKPIIFVGHFLGGSVATLATLWLLGKRLKQSSPFCITFGCPLVGDERLVQAVGRENWVGNFCHVVSKHDIVPQILLAPFKSIAVHLDALLNYWKGIMTNAKKDVSGYFNQSNQDAYTTLVHSLKELDGVKNGSPYRPFGAYIFCSSHGAACIRDSDTVLEMFQSTLQSQEKSSQETVQEHLNYGSVLEEVVQNSIRGRRAISNSESSYKMGISLVLDAIGVAAQNEPARTALERARGIENRHNTYISQLAIELSKAQRSLAELEWYKELCEQRGKGYYDCFKEHNNKKDIDANLRREKLTIFWEEIIKKWEDRELPSDFQSRKKWTYAGNTYSRLVEPLDIAFYYKSPKGNGNYLSNGRSHHHKVLQKWFEENEKRIEGKKVRTKLASLTVDSCFWAYVEEALKDLKQGQHQKLKSLEKFEDYVTRMIQDRSIASDAFLEESSFMEWWKEYKQIQSPEWESSSQLNKIMESESWKG